MNDGNFTTELSRNLMDSKGASNANAMQEHYLLDLAMTMDYGNNRYSNGIVMKKFIPLM
jgi:hypothetical protein